MYDFADTPKIKISANGSTDITSVDAVKFIPSDSFNYDVMGRLAETGTGHEAAGMSAGYRFTYDRAGRLAGVTDGFGRTVSYQYTPAGRRCKMTWPDGFYVTYGYDDAGRLSAIYNNNGVLLWSCVYDAAGRRTQTTGVYGLITDYDYEDITGNDNRGTYLEGIANTLGANTLSFDYSRDLAGNITTEANGGTENFYLYDKNYSLASVDYKPAMI